jgi:hypothetical protein
MKTYRVMVHPQRAVPMVVKVGFCWPAFLIGPLWFLVNGMWLNFVLVSAFVVAGHLFSAAKLTGGSLYGLLAAAYVAVWILVGAIANWLLTSELQEKGYVQRGTVKATSLLKAGKLAQQGSDDA